MIPKHSLTCPICDGNEAKSWHVCEKCQQLTCDFCSNDAGFDDDGYVDRIECDNCFAPPTPTPYTPKDKKTITLTGLSLGDPVPGIWMEINFKQNPINLANAPIPQFEDWYQAPAVSAIFAKKMMQQWDALEEASYVRKAADEFYDFMYEVKKRELGASTHPESIKEASKIMIDSISCTSCKEQSKHAIDHPRGLCYSCSTR